MNYTKKQLIDGAFEELGMASYIFDMTPEEYQSAARRLDGMMSEWSARGVRVGFPASSDPESIDIDSETFLPSGAVETVKTNLAIRIAPSYGKTPSNETKAVAKTGFEVIAGRVAPAGERQYPNTLPMGAGNKYWGWRGVFYPPPQKSALPPPATGMDFQTGE